MSVTPFEVQEALRGRARERREWLMDRSSLSHEDASVMATLDVAVVEIFALTKRAEAAEARRDVWEKRARKVVRERRALRVECEALRKYLLDLLAVVHRDGGHHTEAVGTRQSVVDAELAFYAQRQRAEAAEAEREALRKVDDAMVERACIAWCGAWNWQEEGPAEPQWRAHIREVMRAALTAAMAVQPATGETDAPDDAPEDELTDKEAEGLLLQIGKAISGTEGEHE